MFGDNKRLFTAVFMSKDKDGLPGDNGGLPGPLPKK